MYYVYVGRVDGEIIYVGKGSADRDLHLNSGCSHVYEANRFHFSGGIVDVIRVAENLNEASAFELETHLIHEITPRWNVAAIGNSHKKSHATSKYLGVSFYRNKTVNQWRAWYKIGSKKMHIGCYMTELEAVIARDKFLIDNGITGKLNFVPTG